MNVIKCHAPQNYIFFLQNYIKVEHRDVKTNINKSIKAIE